MRSVTTVLLLVAAAHLAAQQPQFKSTVDLVTLSVTVVDRSGTPIEGLKPEDFSVTLEGAPTAVRTLAYLKVAGSSGTDGTASGAAAAANGSIAGGPRTIVVLFDDLSYRPRPGREMTTSAERMVGALQPQDRVALLSSSRQGRMLAPTADRPALLAALKTMQPRQADEAAPYFVGVPEAFAIERGFPSSQLSQTTMRECYLSGNLSPVCPTQVEQAAKRLAMQMRRTVESQVAAIEGALKLTKTLPEPRLLIVVSNGIHSDGTPGSIQQLEAVAKAAADAGVQVYALTEVGDAVDARDTIAEKARARRESQEFLAGGVQTFIAAAGGEAFKIVGQPDNIVKRILLETSGTYVLGVDTPLLPNRLKFLQAKVRVSRSGAQVRTRAQVLSPTK